MKEAIHGKMVYDMLYPKVAEKFRDHTDNHDFM